MLIFIVWALNQIVYCQLFCIADTIASPNQQTSETMRFCAMASQLCA